MSQHTISRIANILEKQFSTLIDMSDWDGRPDADRRVCFLQRALAALCIRNLAAVDPNIAARAVTDGFHDGGLDAIQFDQKTDTLFLVQTKWSENGNKPLDPDGCASFVSGVRDLLAERFSDFNDKVRAKESEIRVILYSERPIKIIFVTAHTATQVMAAHAERKINELIDELNDPVQIASGRHFNQAGVYGLITAESTPPQITLQIPLKDYGVIDKPFLAYYGRVHVNEIAKWWNDHGNSLFSQNLRLFYSSSEVNDALRNTLANAPQNFWYFNNGITVICKSIIKGLAGSPGRLIGLFTCEGASIVNGAQTVGTIGGAGGIAEDDTQSDIDSLQSWVQVRIISLEACPPEFSRAITRAANLQNAVGYREFAAMDPMQHRIATDLALDRRKYSYKQGEPDPKDADGCSIVEATQALGCAHSISLAVQVKREIGSIWADTETSPYTDIFNNSLSSTRLWRSVLVMRAVDNEIHDLRGTAIPRADLIGVHLNRVILYLVFQDSKVRQLRHDSADEAALIEAAREATKRIFVSVAEYVQREHEGDYLAGLCKNFTKCENLSKVLLMPKEAAAKPPSKQGELFQ
jgi:hypothetical protein